MGPNALEKKLALRAPHRLNYDARSIAQSAPWSLDARPTGDLRRALVFYQGAVTVFRTWIKSNSTSTGDVPPDTTRI